MRGGVLHRCAPIQIRHEIAVRPSPLRLRISTRSSPPSTMGSIHKEEGEKEIKETAENIEKSAPTPPPPPPRALEPPEKPLPGDCCGSGCVRCVWDVYYEELEAYQKSLSSSSSSDESKAS